MQSLELKSSEAEVQPSAESAAEASGATPQEAPPSGTTPTETAARGTTSRILAKNTIWLIGGQLLGMPLGILMSALLARKLGAADFGLLFLITTMSGFAATFSEFGQRGAAQGAIARDRAAAGQLVSSAIVLRLLSFVVAHVILGVAVWLLAYEQKVVIGLAIVAASTLLLQFGETAALASRAFERSDFVARNIFIAQIATVGSTVAALLLGGGLLHVLMVQLAAGFVGLVINWRLLARLGIHLRRFQAKTMKLLAQEGFGFLMLSGVIVLQWNVHAVLLSKLTDAEDVGWYAAAHRLVGFLIFPCGAVTASLYPTLCRLLMEAPEEAQGTARSSLSVVSWIALPVAVSCILFPDIGIQIFSSESYGPAQDNLRIFSLVVFALYFAMVLATYLNALGMQRKWAMLQFGSVVISSALGLVLVPYFGETYGNGGLGMVAGTVFSEAFLVAGGLWLAPRGLINRDFLVPFGWALLSAVAMAAVGALLKPFITSWLAAPVALLTYAGCLRITGVLNDETVGTVKEMVRRKRARARA